MQKYYVFITKNYRFLNLISIRSIFEYSHFFSLILPLYMIFVFWTNGALLLLLLGMNFVGYLKCINVPTGILLADTRNYILLFSKALVKHYSLMFV